MQQQTTRAPKNNRGPTSITARLKSLGGLEAVELFNVYQYPEVSRGDDEQIGELLSYEKKIEALFTLMCRERCELLQDQERLIKYTPAFEENQNELDRYLRSLKTLRKMLSEKIRRRLNVEKDRYIAICAGGIIVTRDEKPKSELIFTGSMGNIELEIILRGDQN